MVVQAPPNTLKSATGRALVLVAGGNAFEGGKTVRDASTPMPVRSPCVKVCELDPANGLCRGCHRTQEERDWWVAYSDVQQREVLRRCEQRRAVLAGGEGEPAPSMGIVESRRKEAPEVPPAA